MGMLYRLMYRIGFTPWDRVLPVELVDMVTGRDALRPGRALDMGSGNGTKAIFMATHGWQVTGVEAVPRAIAESRRRAAEVGADVEFRQGDVTRLEDLGLQPDYTLIFDFGCYHGLNRTQRDDYARGLNQVAADGAILLLMGFSKAAPPVPLPVTETELLSRLGQAWTLVWSHPDESEGTAAMKRNAATWYCVKRV